MYCVGLLVSRTGTTRRICEARAATTSTSRWTCRKRTRPTSPSCARKARSSTPLRHRNARAGIGETGPDKANRDARGQQSSNTAWGGQPCNPYDTARVPRGTSEGSGVSVCGQSGRPAPSASRARPRARDRHPATTSSIIFTTKGVMMDGGIPAPESRRSRRHPLPNRRRRGIVLDAIKGYESGDMFTAIPKGSSRRSRMPASW